MSNFVHLHVHSAFSCLDSVIKVDELVKRTKELGMSSVAITDHGVAAGAIRLYKECEEHSIKPIIGMEAYLSPTDDYTLRAKVEDSPRAYHITLLAKNAEGVNNIYELSSIGFSDGFYYKPRISIPLIEKYKENLIVMGACASGPVNWNLREDNSGSPEKAYLFAGRFKDIFQENFYLELMDHNLDWQKKLNVEVQKLADKMDILTIPTNDAHFLKKEDYYVHCIMMCCQINKKIHELGESGMKYPEDCYFKSPEEMEKIFGKELCLRTKEIEEKVDIKLEFGKTLFPEYKED